MNFGCILAAFWLNFDCILTASSGPSLQLACFYFDLELVLKHFWKKKRAKIQTQDGRYQLYWFYSITAKNVSNDIYVRIFLFLHFSFI